MATMKELLSLMIERINGKPGNWEELTGKPFGLTMGWEIIVEQPDIIGSGYSQEPYSAFVALTDVALEQGKIYKVAINGDEWEVKAFVLPEDTNVYLGDASDRLEEMPFHIYSTADSTICIIWQITPEEYAMGAPVANITISKGYEAVDTLGYEFMPLDYPAVLKEYVEIMPKAVVKFEETGLNGSVYSNSTIINEGLLLEDKAYRITFNGEKYICQTQVWRSSTFLGNLEILTGTDGNDLPFAILGNMLSWKVELGEEVNLQIEEINNIIRPIDKKFIPDGVGGGVRSVNNTMPDENGNVEILLPELQMPEVKWDDITDKPFSPALKVIEIYPKTSVPILSGPVTTSFNGELIAGNNYIVKYNDESYTCKAFDTIYDGGEAVCLGNAIHSFNKIDNPVDTGEDFLFIVRKDMDWEAFCFNQEIEDKTVFISILKEVELNVLDKNYLPNDICEGIQSWNELKDRPFYVISEESVFMPKRTPPWRTPRQGEYYYSQENWSSLLVANAVYDVYLNDIKYTVTAIVESDTKTYIGNSDTTLATGELPFNYTVTEGSGGLNSHKFHWPKSLGKDITLEIIKQEVVKPLDYKFMPEGYPKAEVQLVEILPEKNITVGDYGFAQINAEFELIPNNEYKVIYDDVEYNLIAKVDSEQHILLGGDVTDANDFDYTNCPFVIMENSGNWTLFTETYNVSHIFTVYEEVEIVKQIDPKFLPETVATKAWVEALIGGIENGTY